MRGTRTYNHQHLPVHTHTYSPFSHLESYCSVRIAVLPPMVLNRAASVLIKSICTPAYRLLSVKLCKKQIRVVKPFFFFFFYTAAYRIREELTFLFLLINETHLTDQNCNVLLFGVIGTFSFPWIHIPRDQPKQVVLQRQIRLRTYKQTGKNGYNDSTSVLKYSSLPSV